MGEGAQERRPRSRRSRDERRRQYLDTAVELLTRRFESSLHDSAYALAHVRMADVAAAAGVSKGALYHIWPNQEAYWADLLKAVFADMAPAGMSYGSWIDVFTGDGADTTATIGDLLDQMFEGWVADPSVLTLMSMAAYRHDPTIYAAIRSQMQSLARTYEPLIDELLARVGRGLRDDIEPLDFVIAYRAALDGLAFRYSYSRETFKGLDIDGHQFGVFALMTEAILFGYSRPIDERRQAFDPEHDSGTDGQIGSILLLPIPGPISEYLHTVADQRGDDEQDRGDDAAQRYVMIGLELLRNLVGRHGDPMDLGSLGNLRVSEVAEAAGMSKASIYHLWDSQEAFRLDVLDHLMTSNNDTSVEGLRTTPVPTDPVERILAVSDLSFDNLKDDIRFYARFGFTFASAHPSVADVLADTEIEVREQYMSVIFDALAENQRRLRTDVDENLVRLCIEAALYGTCLVYRHSPELVDGHRHGPDGSRIQDSPTRFAEIVRALLTYFSEAARDHS